MKGVRWALAWIGVMSLEGCYYSWHGDARVQHNASILANSVDELRIGPVAVDRRETHVLRVRDLPWGWYPAALRVVVDSEATARRRAADEWKGVVLRVTLKTVEGRELWSKTCDLSAMREETDYERDGKWVVVYRLRDMPEGVAKLRSYEVEMEVVKASGHAGDEVMLGAW